MYFDNAQLIKDTFGTSYTYDDDGNLIKVTDLQGKYVSFVAAPTLASGVGLVVGVVCAVWATLRYFEIATE